MRSSMDLLRYARVGYAWKDWYASARMHIESTCAAKNWPVGAFTAVLAVTSPRVSVVQNWRATYMWFDKGVLPPNMMRSTRIALGHLVLTGEIRGPKTHAFNRALLGDESALVLDVWMAKALDVPHTKVTSKQNMMAAWRRVVKVSKVLGISIAQTQAAIWAGVCLTNGVRPGNLSDAAQSTAQFDFDF